MQLNRLASAELVRFACVGVFLALLYFVLYVQLSQTMLPIFVVNTIAFGITICVQYVLQAKWTFGRTAANTGQAAKFLVTVGFGYVLSAIITAYIGPALQLSETVTASIVVVTLPVTNFILFKLWVFKKHQLPTHES